MSALQDQLAARFMRYAAIPSQSDAAAGVTPSSPGQLELGRLLMQELQELGLVDIDQDSRGVVTARLPATVPGDAVGFCAHLDTVDVSLSPVIHPQIIDYEGGDIVLNAAENIVMKAADHPELQDYIGQRLICADGTSVLGADNKAALAIVMTALELLAREQRPHAEIFIAFVPDEEIGLCGSKVLDLQKFRPDYAYTIDSCGLGEVVYQTFNAGSVYLTFTGVTAHPMSAKGVLINPLLMAHDFIAMFDRGQTPEHTDGLDGYWWFNACHADALTCTLTMHIRDFDLEHYRWRKEVTAQNVEKLRALYPTAGIEARFEDVYENISNNVSADAAPIAHIYEAMAELGITPRTCAMRGGTDGSCLSARGIVTPNYFTGGHNFHSRDEFWPLGSAEKSLQLTLALIQKALH